MSGIGEAASIIGVTELGLKGIGGLYRFLKEIKDVPEQLERLRGENDSLQNRLTKLSFLTEADQATLSEVQQSGELLSRLATSVDSDSS
jgi:hypothetical protein